MFALMANLYILHSVWSEIKGGTSCWLYANSLCWADGQLLCSGREGGGRWFGPEKEIHLKVQTQRECEYICRVQGNNSQYCILLVYQEIIYKKQRQKTLQNVFKGYLLKAQVTLFVFRVYKAFLYALWEVWKRNRTMSIWPQLSYWLSAGWYKISPGHPALAGLVCTN